MKSILMCERLIKLLLSIAFWTAEWIWFWMRRILGKQISGTCVVLCYHGVTSEQRSRFVQQMDTLVRLAKPISAEFKEPLESGVHYVAITFDDGFASVITNALPELSRSKIPATIFIPTAYLGRYPGWINEDGDPNNLQVIMTADQLRPLNKELVSIGSHSMTHPNLLLINEEDVIKEICESKCELEKITDRDIKVFAFPHGAHNKFLVDLTKKVGYKRVFTILPKLTFLDAEEYLIGRVCVSPNDWFLEFKLKVLGSYRWLAAAFALKRCIRFLLSNNIGVHNS